MTRRLLPRMLVGGLLVASFIAWAANGLSPSTINGPDLYSVYKQTHSQKIPTVKTASAYIDALVAQQQMNILQQRLSFYQDDLKAVKSKAGLFSHVDPEIASQLNSDIDLARAAYFGAKMEWKSSLQTLNSVTQQYYEGVKPLAENFVIVVPKASKKTSAVIQAAHQLQKQLRVVQAQKKTLDEKLYSYNRGYVKIQAVIDQGIQYYQAQEKFWNLASTYMKQTVNLNIYQNKLSEGMIQRFNQTLYQPEKAKQWLHTEHKAKTHKIIKHRKRRHEEYVKARPVKPKVVEHKAAQHKVAAPLSKVKSSSLLRRKSSLVELKPLVEPKAVKIKVAKPKRPLVKLPQPKTEPVKHHHVVKKTHKKIAYISKVKTSPLLRHEEALLELKPLVEPRAVKQHRQLVKLPRPRTRLSRAKTSPLLRQETASIETKLAHISKPKRHIMIAHHAVVHHHKKHKQRAHEKFYILPEPNSTLLKFVI